MFIGVLDLLGVVLIGLLASITTLNVANVEAGGVTARLMTFLSLESFNLKDSLIFLGCVAAFFFVTKSLLSLFLQKLTIDFVADKSFVLADNLVRKLLNLSLIRFRKYSQADLNYIFSSGIQRVMQGLISRPIFALSDTFLVAILSLGIFVADSTLAFLILGYFAVLAGSLYKLQHNRMRSLSLEMRNLHIENLTQVKDIVNSYKFITTGGLQNRYAQKIRENRFGLSRATAKLNFINTIGKYVIEVASVFGVVVVSITLFATRAPSTAAALIALFISASFRIGPAALRLQSFFVGLKVDLVAARPALEMIRDLKREDLIQSNTHANLLKHEVSGWTIKLDKVSFGYDNVFEIIKDLDLTIKEGEHLGLVGPSGGGKTTLLDLLLGLIRPTSGTIKFGEFTPTQFIRNFPGAVAYVAQDSSISGNTLRSCILGPYESSEVPDYKILETLKRVSMESLVLDLFGGLDHKISDDGSNLSGGQKQRISIARALLSNPKILVLDEATSNLDNQTQKEIMEEIRTLKGNCTVIVVAHRLEVLEHMDRVIEIGQRRP